MSPWFFILSDISLKGHSIGVMCLKAIVSVNGSVTLKFTILIGFKVKLINYFSTKLCYNYHASNSHY